MQHLIKRHRISIQHAFDGLMWAYKTQPNYLVHLLFSGLTVAGGFYFSIRYEEWLIIIITITMGLVIETINTAIEATTDAIDKTIRDDIKIAKDTAAAAMLTYACGALLIAAIIFYPYVVNLVQ